jgi:hypothetical protein
MRSNAVHFDVADDGDVITLSFAFAPTCGVNITIDRDDELSVDFVVDDQAFLCAPGTSRRERVRKFLEDAIGPRRRADA